MRELNGLVRGMKAVNIMKAIGKEIGAALSMSTAGIMTGTGIIEAMITIMTMTTIGTNCHD
jgi:hypothetical protein